jgi:fatty-acyl-CoA synthase
MGSSLDNLLRPLPGHAGGLAITWESREISYRDLAGAVDRLAAQLPDGLAGQRVGVLAPNMPALVIGMFAAWRCGAVAVPLNARWRAYELGRILPDAEPAALISVEKYHGFSFGNLLASLLPGLPTLRRCCFVNPMGETTHSLEGPSAESATALGGDVGLLLYTSGTTGAPKGALVRHTTYLEGATAINGVLDARPDDVSLFVVPISHAFGLETLVATLASGGQAALVDSSFSMGPLVEVLRRRGATILHGSPALFISLLKYAVSDLAAIRTGFVAGASCPPQVLEQLDQAGPRILNLYGMTEIGAACCCRPDDPPQVRYHTVGRPLSGYTFRVSGGSGGEIQVRGPYVTPGYHRQADQTAASYKDGWFCTGDLGLMDEHGNLCISGRAKEVIHVAGLNVFPAELEGLLLTHPEVAQVVVVAVPHPSFGEAPQAFVVLRPGADLTPAALLQFARERLAGYKLPYVIRLLPELPSLASGKPDRAALARLAQEEGHVASQPRTNTAF